MFWQEESYPEAAQDCFGNNHVPLSFFVPDIFFFGENCKNFGGFPEITTVCSLPRNFFTSCVGCFLMTLRRGDPRNVFPLWKTPKKYQEISDKIRPSYDHDFNGRKNIGDFPDIFDLYRR